MSRAATGADSITEAAFQSQVTDLADMLGYDWFHTHDSRRCPPGFPDLVLVGSRVIFAELKTAIGRVRPAQADWINRLAAAGELAYIWRPADLDSIRDTLQRHR